jgi:hypothetical protein
MIEESVQTVAKPFAAFIRYAPNLSGKIER